MKKINVLVFKKTTTSSVILLNGFLNQCFKIFLSMGVLVFLSACVIAEKAPEATSMNSEPAKVRRQIKDVDYRNTNVDRGPRKRVVVLPFLDQKAQPFVESVKENAHVAFVNDLNNSDKVLVVDISQLSTPGKKIEPAQFLKNQEYDLKKMAQEAAKSGVSSILEGQIIDVRMKKAADQIGVIRNLTATYEVVVRLRIVNVRTEQEIYNTVKTVTIEEQNTRVAERVAEDQLFIKNPKLVEILIKDAFLDFAPQIQEALNDVTWEGRIAAVRGDKIYLNVGRLSGVQVGDILKVVEDSSEIYDPELGYHLGKIRGKVKGTVEIVSYFGNDGAVSVLHSGAGFKESDRVELYQ